MLFCSVLRQTSYVHIHGLQCVNGHDDAQMFMMRFFNCLMKNFVHDLTEESVVSASMTKRNLKKLNCK